MTRSNPSFCQVSFSITFFFVCMGLLTAGASDGDSKSGFRTCVHNGFWLLKLVLILSLIVAIFVVPISHLVRIIMCSVLLNRNQDKLQ